MEATAYVPAAARIATAMSARNFQEVLSRSMTSPRTEQTTAEGSSQRGEVSLLLAVAQRHHAADPAEVQRRLSAARRAPHRDPRVVVVVEPAVAREPLPHHLAGAAVER